MRTDGRVRRAVPEDAAAAAAALARAAEDEAVVKWITPDPAVRRRRAEEAGEYFAAWLTAMMSTGEVHLVEAGGAVAGLALWQYSDAGAGPRVEPAAEAPGDDADDVLRRVYGDDLPRLLLVNELVGERHPAGVSYWYLAQIVVVPELRGRGLGGALLRHQLERVDEQGTAAYLEASSPRNRVLYERHGFRALGGPVVLPDGGPLLQPMWRPRADRGE
ncbi:GNAT family N-acetyltransferase [Streptomyces poonensis]|uniref:N-acetyltransferase n=1 Tax=Streptomyces poonensis TaxID=68255 RepID=A0A918Q1P4_9ACTN|nr:GNAT family N-acetyltransferase [Streptomyces poonensis]GGZ30193.1 N-acetyltransferase [Streptomyces poonensis]